MVNDIEDNELTYKALLHIWIKVMINRFMIVGGLVDLALKIF